MKFIKSVGEGRMEGKKKVNCDMLVVGGGNTGLVAAIEAKKPGRMFS